MSLQNFPDGPATEESPRLRDRGTGSHQTPLSSNSEGPEGPRERVSAAVTALALRTSQLSTADKRKLIAECRRLGLPGNMNIARRTLQRRILAHLNDLRRAVDDADDASKMGRLDALLAATSGDLHAEDHGRPSSSGVGGARPDRTISADDAAAITPMDLEASPEREKRPANRSLFHATKLMSRLLAGSAVRVSLRRRLRRAAGPTRTRRSGRPVSTNCWQRTRRCAA